MTDHSILLGRLHSSSGTPGSALSWSISYLSDFLILILIQLKFTTVPLLTANPTHCSYRWCPPRLCAWSPLVHAVLSHIIHHSTAVNQKWSSLATNLSSQDFTQHTGHTGSSSLFVWKLSIILDCTLSLKSNINNNQNLLLPFLWHCTSWFHPLPLHWGNIYPCLQKLQTGVLKQHSLQPLKTTICSRLNCHSY